jgi:hypothetical protein
MSIRPMKRCGANRSQEESQLRDLIAALLASLKEKA